MRIAVYVRVSTSRQAQSQTIDQQLDRLREHIAAAGERLAEEDIFRDDGFSGATLNRPGLDRLRDRVRAADVDRVVLTTPDRLARNYVHQMLLLEEFQRSGCQVEFLDRPLPNDPHEQLLLQIRGAVAEYERTLIGERMRRGRLARYRAGMLLPWTKTPLGYRVDPERPRDPCGVRVEDAEAAEVAQIFASYLSEHGMLSGVIRELNAHGVPSPRGKCGWSRSTIRFILTNPAYTGQVYAGRMRKRALRSRRSPMLPVGQATSGVGPAPRQEWIAAASIPAIISQEQFELAQAKLSHNQRTARRNNTSHEYLLRAMVSCGMCRLGCRGQTWDPGYSYYVCRGKAKLCETGREEKCRARHIPAKQLDALVWADLCEVVTHPEAIIHGLERAWGGHWLPQELQARREMLRKGRATLDRQVERLTEAYLSGVMALAEYERRRRDLEGKVQALRSQEQQMEAQVDQRIELAGVVSSVEDFCRRVQSGLATATFEQRRELIELLIDRVIVTGSDVEIRYVIPTTPRSEQVRFCHLRTDHLDGLPGRVLARHVTPRAARAQDVEDAIEDQAHIRVAWAAAGLGRRDETFDTLPFSVGEVAWVELVAHTRMLPKPAETF